MRIALVDGTKKSNIYPLPLLKIGAWRKSIGDEVKIFYGSLPKAGAYDEIWITTKFTFDIPFAVGLTREAKSRARRVYVGGISATLLPEYFRREGVDVHIGLIPEAEPFHPDYSLLGFAPEYSITHTSRGCIRKCGFCMVSKLETEFCDRPEWDKDISPETRRILFFDNNWLAKPKKLLIRDVEKIRALMANNHIREVDFNQGLDARLVTEEIADLLAGLPIRPIRFAFDGMHEDKYYQTAITRMAARGHKDFRNYVLYNFKDTPEDFYYRLREGVRLSLELGIKVDSFPMRFQPILDVDNGRDYLGANWNPKARSGFMTIMGSASTSGQISFQNMAHFELFFGKNAAEFVKLINYPKIHELSEKRSGYLRMCRATGKAVDDGAAD